MEVRWMLLEPAQRRGPILAGRRPLRIGWVLTHAGWIVQERLRIAARADSVLQHVGHRRSLVAGRASRFISEDMFPSRCGSGVKTSARGLGSAKAQLIREQRRQLRRHEIGRVADGQANSWIAEVSLTAHLTNAYVSVPIGD